MSDSCCPHFVSQVGARGGTAKAQVSVSLTMSDLVELSVPFFGDPLLGW